MLTVPVDALKHWPDGPASGRKLNLQVSSQVHGSRKNNILRQTVLYFIG